MTENSPVFKPQNPTREGTGSHHEKYKGTEVFGRNGRFTPSVCSFQEERDAVSITSFFVVVLCFYFSRVYTRCRVASHLVILYLTF